MYVVCNYLVSEVCSIHILSMIYKYLIQWYFGKNVASMILKFNNIEIIFFNVPKMKISIPKMKIAIINDI